MRFFLSLLLVLPFAAGASELDQKLQGYITKFNLKSLEKPTNRNTDLFKLGQFLFMDRNLSGNKNISCAECHHPAALTTDQLPLGLGEGAQGIQSPTTRRNQKKGAILARNTPALFNLEGINVMFWDGRVSFDPASNTFITPVKELNGVNPLRSDITSSLTDAVAAQAIFPIVNHEEMLGKKGSNPIASAANELEAWSLVVERLMTYRHYQEKFAAIFPGEKINIGHIGQALSEFQRHAFFFADTPYDRYLKGDAKAMNEIQKIGMDVFFNKGKCGECHNGAHLTNFEFHNVGIPQIGPGKENGDDLGRYQWNKDPKNLYAFRVPALRNVSMTAPYMHDGAFKTIPQIVEHYDMIEESLTSYQLVNNWKNYVENILDHNHSDDNVRISSLSEKLTRRLEFKEEEEKALSEFIQTALTDTYFLNSEVGGDYKTYYRIQLKESGFKKLAAVYKGRKEQQTFYYFDLIWEGGFALRGFANPMRLILVKNENGMELVYREQVWKSALAENGVVVGANFNRQEMVSVSPEVFLPLEGAYLDMFNRIYTYVDGTRKDPIPSMELAVIKRDIDLMNQQFHLIPFAGADAISDQMNASKENLFYVPTSYNSKDATLFTINVAGKTVEANLQKSVLRTETGALETTYALELETQKVTKAEFAAFSNELMKKLNVLKEEDVGGGSPSPSLLTLEVLNQVLE